MTDHEQLEALVDRLKQVLSDILQHAQEAKLREFTFYGRTYGITVSKTCATKNGLTVQFVDCSEMRHDH